MARTLDPEAHAIRREAFIDAAERLIQAKGYEQMSIQDVLDETEASRGAFYHYFDSKAALLEAVLDRMVETVMSMAATVVDDESLTAPQKLEGLLRGITQWKLDRGDLMLAILRVWLSDENAIVREKLRLGVAAHLTPPLAAIVRQGVDEGVFTVGSAEHSARVVVSLLLGLNEAATRLYVGRQSDSVEYEDVERTIAAFVDAEERILGLAAGSLDIVDYDVVREWFG